VTVCVELTISEFQALVAPYTLNLQSGRAFDDAVRNLLTGLFRHDVSQNQATEVLQVH
jgi:hypothetical protein